MGLAAKTDREIETWIANHEEQQATAKPFYLELLEERARRSQIKQKLNFDLSLAHIIDAAIRQTCTTYGALAKASAIEWSQARHQMNGPNGHLDRLLDICYARKLPLLTAICVNQGSVDAGELEKDALAGFVGGAKRLGLFVGDPVSFHHKCRDECWGWGRNQATEGER